MPGSSRRRGRLHVQARGHAPVVAVPGDRAGGEARQPGRPAVRGAGTQLGGRLGPDQLAPGVGVFAGKQRLDRHVGEVGVAVPGLPVGERELAAFGHGVHVVRGARTHGRQVEAVEQRELLEEHRTLPPGLGLAHGQAADVVGQRLLEPRVPARQVGVGQQPPVRPAGHVHDLGGGHVGGDRLGDETLVVDPPGGLDLLVAIVARRFRLVQDALVGGGQRGVGEQRAWRGHMAVRQVDLGRARPVVPEQLGHAGDTPADRGQQRVAAGRVPDRVAHHVPQPEGAVLPQQQHPGPERAGHAGGEQPAAGHEVKPEAGERLRGGRGRRGSLPAEHEGLAAAGVMGDDRDLTTEAVQVRLDHLKHEAGRDGRVERVTAVLEDGQPGRRGEPVRRGHHAERARQFGPGREFGNVAHDPIFSSSPRRPGVAAEQPRGVPGASPVASLR